MVLYNALPKKEYERIFMCKTAKDVWNFLVITHQGNKQVKDNKIDLFDQQYEQSVFSDNETIHCAFARFNTIVTSLKPLDESFSSCNHVRKFLRTLPIKWRLKMMAIEESKDLSTLLLDELIGNLKVYEVVLEKDSKASKNKKEKYKSLALKAKKVSSSEEASCSDSNVEEHAMANFRRAKEEKKGKEEQMCFKCGDPNHFISDCPKHSFNDQKAFVGGCYSKSEEDDDSKKDKICLMAHDKNEVQLKIKLEHDEWIKNSGCSRHMTGNKELFSTYEAINGGNAVFGSNTKTGRQELSAGQLASAFGRIEMSQSARLSAGRLAASDKKKLKTRMGHQGIIKVLEWFMAIEREWRWLLRVEERIDEAMMKNTTKEV
ncbi:zf-CCHC domain-containing protein [Tanacetum coccineum]